MGSTSSANDRYRLTGIEEPRCGFHAGCPGAGGPAGCTMLRAERNASGLEVTVVAPGISEGELQTGASRTPATGSRSGSDPVAASEEEHPLHVLHFTALSAWVKSAPRSQRYRRRGARYRAVHH